jgi:hypothetical protein
MWLAPTVRRLSAWDGDCSLNWSERPDRTLLDEWMANWTDLIDFEVRSVITSKEAAEKIAL